MKMDNPFNIRVYGIYIVDRKVMLSQEVYKDYNFLKFPGGGLEYGESTKECLEREFQEEFDVKIDILEHFYTTDFFQKSILNDQQIISIYYKMDVTNKITFPFSTNNNETLDLYDIDAHLLTKISLPIDKFVVQKLITSI